MSKKSRDLLSASEKSDHFSEERVALVIGNSTYKDAPLRNPANDAADMAKVLTQLGFTVSELQNASRIEMIEAFDDFGRKLHRGGVGLFYYAGHGVQVKGLNYLIPIGATIKKSLHVEFEAVDVNRVLAEMEDADNRVNIVILDACRNNPYERRFRSASTGLAMMDAPSGTLIAYSTAPGKVAADGAGRNSPYTGTLLPTLQLEALEVEKVFKKVRVKVIKESSHQQIPWESSSLTGDFYFIPPEPFLDPSHVKIIRPPDPSDFLPGVQMTMPAAKPSVILRSVPESNFSGDAVKEMLRTKGFYDKYKNPGGKGITYQYELQLEGQVVFDATTGLMWQQSGSNNLMIYNDANTYIARLNLDRYAGYTDWRLPTLEEAMSLMVPEKLGNDLYIDPVFNWKQRWIWTSDQDEASRIWCVGFHGYCVNDGIGPLVYIRAVRFGQSTPGFVAKSVNKSTKLSMKAKQPTKTTVAIENPSAILRSTPESNFPEAAVKEMLKTKGFYDKYKNPGGKGITHQYELQAGGKVVFDGATKLTWQQSGSDEYMTLEDAKTYIVRLNQDKFANYSDWRLPTLEEAMSLMSRAKNGDKGYIDPFFGAEKDWIWTSDQSSTSGMWVVSFGDGFCSLEFINGYYVRAVRFGQSSQ